VKSQSLYREKAVYDDSSRSQSLYRLDFPKSQGVHSGPDLYRTNLGIFLPSPRLLIIGRERSEFSKSQSLYNRYSFIFSAHFFIFFHIFHILRQIFLTHRQEGGGSDELISGNSPLPTEIFSKLNLLDLYPGYSSKFLKSFSCLYF